MDLDNEMVDPKAVFWGVLCGSKDNRHFWITKKGDCRVEEFPVRIWYGLVDKKLDLANEGNMAEMGVEREDKGTSRLNARPPSKWVGTSFGRLVERYK